MFRVAETILIIFHFMRSHKRKLFVKPCESTQERRTRSCELLLTPPAKREAKKTTQNVVIVYQKIINKLTLAACVFILLIYEENIFYIIIWREANFNEIIELKGKLFLFFRTHRSTIDSIDFRERPMEACTACSILQSIPSQFLRRI